MVGESEESQWAFDCRPWEGARWHEDKPDESMKEKFPNGKMVHIGIKSDWNPEETGRKNRVGHGPWTKPITRAAEKAQHGSFDSGRYLCCDDEHCGVRVSVKQGPIMKWHFSRQPESRSKAQSCINRSKWVGESRFHNITKRHIARTLNLSSWKKEYSINTVHLEKQIKFDRENEVVPLQPDVHLVLDDGTKIYIEVVWKNPPKKLHHDLYGDKLAIVDLKDEANRVVLSVDDDDQKIRNFQKWIRDGGVEVALREELDVKQREKLFKRREENFTRHNITVVRDYLTEIEENPQNKFYRLSEKWLKTLTEQLDDGMSKAMVKALYDEILERQELEEEIQLEIDRIKRQTNYDVADFSPEQFDSVEEVEPFVKEDFKNKMNSKQKELSLQYQFDLELDVNPKYREERWLSYDQVGTPRQIVDAFKTVAPMRKKEFAKREETGVELDIVFIELLEEFYIDGATFHASKARHITQIYDFATPIMLEHMRCEKEYGFDANLEFKITKKPKDSTTKAGTHFIVSRSEDVEIAYLIEKDLREQSRERAKDWENFHSSLKVSCENKLSPLLTEISGYLEGISEGSNVDVDKNKEYVSKLKHLTEYRFFAEFPSPEHKLARGYSLDVKLEDYSDQLNEKCPTILTSREEIHHCFNLDYLELNEIIERLDGVLQDERALYDNLIFQMRFLEARGSFFDKLVEIMKHRKFSKHSFNIEKEKAEEIQSKVNGWLQMNYSQKTDFCSNRGIKSKEALMKCLGLSEDDFDIEGLDDETLTKHYWKINPMDMMNYKLGTDPLYPGYRPFYNNGWR